MSAASRSILPSLALASIAFGSGCGASDPRSLDTPSATIETAIEHSPSEPVVPAPSVDSPASPLRAEDVGAETALEPIADQTLRAVQHALERAVSAGSRASDEHALALGLRRDAPTTCTYRTYSWSTVERRSVGHRNVEKAYADVVDDERSPEDGRCTVCREDQVSVDPAAHGYPGIDPVDVCWVYAEAVGAALESMAQGGFDLQTLTAYRPGRTRGAIVDGLRTEWSNHSFGTAIDINAHHNGLYRSCSVSEVTEDSLQRCRLGIGGAWEPSRRPGSTVVRGGPAYRAFTELVGWAWGGEITGNTRDLMHFSLTGY